jgi:preprotein translocase subunit SecD
MHIRTPVMIGVVGLLVVLLSSFCYYQMGGV